MNRDALQLVPRGPASDQDPRAVGIDRTSGSTRQDALLFSRFSLGSGRAVDQYVVMGRLDPRIDTSIGLNQAYR